LHQKLYKNTGCLYKQRLQAHGILS
jgi:hypothetical protein